LVKQNANCVEIMLVCVKIFKGKTSGNIERHGCNKIEYVKDKEKFFR
jgi:hypothetical protein